MLPIHDRLVGASGIVAVSTVILLASSVKMIAEELAGAQAAGRYLATGVIEDAVPMKQADMRCKIMRHMDWRPNGWDAFFTLRNITICSRGENDVVAYFVKDLDTWFGWPERMGIVQQSNMPQSTFDFELQVYESTGSIQGAVPGVAASCPNLPYSKWRPDGWEYGFELYLNVCLDDHGQITGYQHPVGRAWWRYDPDRLPRKGYLARLHTQLNSDPEFSNAPPGLGTKLNSPEPDDACMDDFLPSAGWTDESSDTAYISPGCWKNDADSPYAYKSTDGWWYVLQPNVQPQ
jgi:hypothetical protein